MEGEDASEDRPTGSTWWYTDIEARASGISGGPAFSALLLVLRATSVVRDTAARLRRALR